MNSDINRSLREAQAFVRTAEKAEAEGAKQYEMKMKSAGASAYAAFKLALHEADEFKGRKIDDAAIRRIYQSTKARPWWDRHLQAVKQDREWGKRLIQWHLDPDAAKARDIGMRLRVANTRKLQGKSPTRGVRTPQAAPTRQAMQAVARAATTTAIAERELPPVAPPTDVVRTADLINECERIRRAVLAVKAPERAEVMDILKTTAGEIERYV